jgi:hypothetical protein
MDRSVAEKLMQHYLAAGGAALNEATSVIGTLADAEEQRRLRRPLGELMQSIYLELMRPIVKEHPELDPDRSP